MTAAVAVMDATPRREAIQLRTSAGKSNLTINTSTEPALVYFPPG